MEYLARCVQAMSWYSRYNAGSVVYTIYRIWKMQDVRGLVPTVRDLESEIDFLFS